MSSPLRILQVSFADIEGGAEKVGLMLHQHYLEQGHDAWLAVGHKRSRDPRVLPISHDLDRHRWARTWIGLGRRLQPWVGRVRGMGRVQRLLGAAGEPLRAWKAWRGQEDFDQPGTRSLLDLPPRRPHILHCHNLHRDYFDLRALPALSWQVPVVLTLHDEWLLTGHCAYTFNCDRWRSGCRHCGDLHIYPPIRHDATAFNWERKRDIYARSRFCVATPSQWLMSHVNQSMLRPAVVEQQVIPYGVDLAVFRPGERAQARTALGIDPQAKVLLFAANGIRQNMFKDYATLREAVQRIAAMMPGEQVLFLALGDGSPEEQAGSATIRFVPFQSDPRAVARYYHAADLYLHAARADNFPNAILEALACGTPVVATAVGGIPEQIRSLWPLDSHDAAADPPTGALVPPGDPQAMAQAAVKLLQEAELLNALGQHAADDARQRFDLERQCQRYIDWYCQILDTQQRAEPPAVARATSP